MPEAIATNPKPIGRNTQVLVAVTSQFPAHPEGLPRRRYAITTIRHDPKRAQGLLEQCIERFAEAVAGEGEAGFGYGEGQGEICVVGFGPAEKGDGIDFRGGELVAFARPVAADPSLSIEFDELSVIRLESPKYLLGGWVINQIIVELRVVHPADQNPLNEKPFMNKLDRWFWEHAFPHILIATLAGVAAYVLPDPLWKALALAAACLAILALVSLRFAWPVLRRNFRDAKNAQMRARITHKLAHVTRNEMVKLMPPVSLVASGSTSAIRCLPSLVEADSVDVARLLNEVVELLRTHVNYGVSVWGSIRELRADGKYHTVARLGEGFHPAREKESTALDERAMTVQQLRNSYNRKKCVILTGSTRGDELWTPQPSDRFGDDKAVLMGAVVVNSLTDRSPEDRLMVWVVSICSDTENAFVSAHIPVMQGAVEHFSIVANVLAREAWLKRPQPSSEGHFSV